MVAPLLTTALLQSLKQYELYKAEFREKAFKRFFDEHHKEDWCDVLCYVANSTIELVRLLRFQERYMTSRVLAAQQDAIRAIPENYHGSHPLRACN